MKRFPTKHFKAPSVEQKFEGSKPLPPGPTKLSKRMRERMIKVWGPVMGKEFIGISEDSLRRLTCKTKAEYRKRFAEWKADLTAAINARDASIRQQRQDEQNRYYACSRCGTESSFDGRDSWQNCVHNDRFIEQRDRRQSYSNSDDRDYR
jgi:hypothetical protein